jgi:glycosyltransferase involved in cell wall biosynthesis
MEDSSLTRPPRAAESPAPGKTVVVLPAYNAELTLRELVSRIPRQPGDEMVLVDDASTDRTVEVARAVPGLAVVRHPENRGYGGNQKTCYREALARGADYVVMVHPDGQYEARVIPAALAVLRLGVCDLVLGNRIRTRREALEGGMPRLKYLSNRGLTFFENVLSGQNLGEWHSGFRAYRREVLTAIPFERNSDDFVFDSQFLVQAVHFGFRLGDVPVPVRYFEEASSISLGRSTRYALATLWTFVRWYLHRWRIYRFGLLEPMSMPPSSVDERVSEPLSEDTSELSPEEIRERTSSRSHTRTQRSR